MTDSSRENERVSWWDADSSKAFREPTSECSIGKAWQTETAAPVCKERRYSSFRRWNPHRCSTPGNSDVRCEQCRCTVIHVEFLVYAPLPKGDFPERSAAGRARSRPLATRSRWLVPRITHNQRVHGGGSQAMYREVIRKAYESREFPWPRARAAVAGEEARLGNGRHARDLRYCRNFRCVITWKCWILTPRSAYRVYPPLRAASPLLRARTELVAAEKAEHARVQSAARRQRSIRLAIPIREQECVIYV